MAIAMSHEQFMTLMAAVTARAGGQREAGGGGGGRRTINDKGFNRVAKFSHGEGEWSDWSFDFKVALGAQSPEMKQTIEVVEKLPEMVTQDQVRQMDEGRADRIGLEKLSTELYEILVLATEGEAKLMVKTVDTNDGLLAWQKLYGHYNRRTLTRILRAHREVLHPKGQKDMTNLISAIMEWEEKWRKMEKEERSGKIPVLWKMAAFMEVCPPEVQDIVYQSIDDIGEDYEKLKQKVVSWTSNKMAARGGPVPMDIGGVRPGEENEYCTDHEAIDVDAIGSHMQCYSCGGWGHASRVCPSTKGGKGGKDYGGKGGKGGASGGKGPGWQNYGGKDGGGKGASWQNHGGKEGSGGKGFAQNPKGGGKAFGKGYQGTCFKCGKVGHKAWECQARQYPAGAVGEVQGYEEEEVEVGTATAIWTVGNVEVKESDKTEKKGKNKHMTSIYNKFEVLADGAEDEEVPPNFVTEIGGVDDKFEVLAAGADDEEAPPNFVTEIGGVDDQGKKKRGKVTVDSGAGASCWPQGWLPKVPMLPKKKGVRFVAAQGSNMEYDGRKMVKFRALRSEGGEVKKGSLSEMEFHVTDSTKALASAVAIVEAGNRIVFSKEKGGASLRTRRRRRGYT
jgi:hypothetical protein